MTGLIQAFDNYLLQNYPGHIIKKLTWTIRFNDGIKDLAQITIKSKHGYLYYVYTLPDSHLKDSYLIGSKVYNHQPTDYIYIRFTNGDLIPKTVKKAIVDFLKEVFKQFIEEKDKEA